MFGQAQVKWTTKKDKMTNPYPKVIAEIEAADKEDKLHPFQITTLFSEKTLWLNFIDLVGNFRIDRKESKRILERVKKIEYQSSNFLV